MTPKPITREDMYYNYLISGQGALPEPITRREHYLHYLCVNGSGADGVSSNYNSLTGKPQINGTTLQGNKSLEDIGIGTESQDIDFSRYFT